jgi:hypothetical protein
MNCTIDSSSVFLAHYTKNHLNQGVKKDITTHTLNSLPCEWSNITLSKDGYTALLIVRRGKIRGKGTNKLHVAFESGHAVFYQGKELLHPFYRSLEVSLDVPIMELLRKHFCFKE